MEFRRLLYIEHLNLRL